MARERKTKIGSRVLSIRETVLDRAIAYVDPVRGAQRMRARFFAEALGGSGSRPGGYGTHRKRRQLGEWNPSNGDADADLLPDLPDLREESRDLIRTSPLAAGAIKTKVTSIVGAGFRLNASVNRELLGLDDARADELEASFEREWRLFAESTELDLERACNFNALCRLVMQSRLESGDVLVLMPFIERPGGPYGLKLQVVEGDRLCNPNFKADDEKIAGGVERDKYGTPIAYHIARRHPGSRSPRAGEWDRREAYTKSGERRVLHIFDKRRPGQSRGVPDLAPVIELLKQLGRYTDAEIAAAVVSGMFTVFVKTPTGEGLAPMQPQASVGGERTDKDFKLGNGALLELAVGEDVTFADPKRPNTAFDPFVLSVLRQIGVGLELPFELLVKHFTASYSAARAAILEAWRYFMLERSMLRDQFCQPVYEALITEAVARGRVTAPGFLAGDPIIRKAYLGATWIGPGRGHLDEKKEADAAVVRIENNLSTKAEETAAINGGDFDMNLRQRRREIAAERDAGLSAAAPTSSDPADEPDDDDTPDPDAPEGEVEN